MLIARSIAPPGDGGECGGEPRKDAVDICFDVCGRCLEDAVTAFGERCSSRRPRFPNFDVFPGGTISITVRNGNETRSAMCGPIGT